MNIHRWPDHPIVVRSNIIIQGWRAEDEEVAKKALLDTSGPLSLMGVLDKSRTVLPVTEQRGHNLVTLSGRNLIVNLLDGVDSPLSHFAIGTGATATADGDAGLVTEVHREVITQTVRAPSTLTVKYFLGSTQLNGTTLREAGVFNSASGPTMFARYLISPVIAKDSTLAFTFGWVFTFSSI